MSSFLNFLLGNKRHLQAFTAFFLLFICFRDMRISRARDQHGEPGVLGYRFHFSFVVFCQAAQPGVHALSLLVFHSELYS